MATATEAPVRLQFSHCGINVLDMDRMVDYYTRVLGYTITDRGETIGLTVVFLSMDPREHHQLVLASGRPHDVPRNTHNPLFGGVMNQISFRVGNLADLRTMHARIVKEGAEGITPANHGNAWSVYSNDPEGNNVEIFVDSPWYTPQPCFMPLDLAKSDEEIHRETEEMVRKEKGFAPREAWRAEITKRMGFA